MSLKTINDLNRHVTPIASEIQQAVARVLASGWFVLGPEVNAFEQEFAAYCQSKHCISLANGTDALELALRAINIGKNNNVLTVANAGMYSSTAILAVGATPVYADIQADSLLIDYDDIKHILSQQKIDAIIITHLYGLLADIQPIIALAKQHNIPVIEDCAQAHGATLNGKKAGTFADIGCFSFYPTKNLGALGDGGAVITDNTELAERVKQLRQYGWSSKYRATLAGGVNSRLDEIQAAILRVMLPNLDKWNNKRREIATQYSQRICHENIITPKTHQENYVSHLYVIKVNKRDSLKQHLLSFNIPHDIHYPIPDYQQPAYADIFKGIIKPVTEQQCNQVLTLPCFPEMTDIEVDSVINIINSWKP